MIKCLLHYVDYLDEVFNTSIRAPETQQCECTNQENIIASGDIGTTGIIETCAVGESNLVTGAVLGGVAFIVFLILVCVIIGWVRTCYKIKSSKR